MDNEISYHILGPENAHLLTDTDVFDHPVDPAQLENFVSIPGHEMIFAVERANVIGIASGTVLLHPDKKPMLFINEVGVKDDRRRRGIAIALCKRLMEHAQEIGCQGIWVATEADNLAANALYQKLGGRSSDEIVVYDWHGAMDV